MVIEEKPKVTLKFHQFRYMSDSRDSGVSAIAKELDLDPQDVHAAMYQMGISDRPPDYEEPKDRPWTNEEQARLQRDYGIVPDYQIARELGRTAKVIQGEAIRLGLNRLSTLEAYSIPQVLEKTGMTYDEVLGAIFSGELRTRIISPEEKKFNQGSVYQGSAYYYVTAIDGASLLDYLERRRTGGVLKSPWTRAERFLFGEGSEERLRTIYGADRGQDDSFYEHLVRTVKAVPTLNEQFRARLNLVPLPDFDEETQLLERIRAGDRLALNDLMEANFRFVMKVASHMLVRAHGKLEFMDLVQEGIIGLHKAAIEYDLDKHKGTGREERYRFLTYAGWWIMQNMGRAIENTADTIRKPVHITGIDSSMHKVTAFYTNNFGREPTLEEISEATGVRVSTIKRIHDVSENALRSLDAEIYGQDGDAAYLSDLVADTGPGPEELILQEIEDQEVNLKLNAVLTVKQKDVVERRLGLNGKRVETLEEIGRSYKNSRESIRQLEATAFKKLRPYFEQPTNPN